jgi:adenine-specific DNA-methyltransferase
MPTPPQRKADRQPVERTSAPVLQQQISKVRKLFPEAVAEGKIDFDKLRATLGEWIDPGREKFSFTWAGKQDAIAILQTPSRATLIPCSDESVNCDTTQHLFIEGDNLEVLKLLFKPYFGRVKMIYIDPPYNTGQDFIYPDNYADPLAVYLQLTGQTDETGNLLTSNPETSGRYHSAWLSMMYPRLFLARQLLADDGVIFVSTDDHEVHHLRIVMNEVFGEENFVECFVWKRSYGGGAKEKYAVSQHEYILLFGREMEALAELWLPPDPEVERKYYKYRDDKFEKRGPYRLQPLEAGKSMDKRPNLVFAIPLPEGGEATPKRQWLWNQDRVNQAIASNELVFNRKEGEVIVSYKQYLLSETGEKRGAKPVSVIDGIYTQHGTQELSELFEGKVVLQFPKPVKLMKMLAQFGTNRSEGDIVLDFFAGSCTTAQAVLELNQEDGGNRKCIMVQLPEVTSDDSVAKKLGFKTIADVGKERVRRVIARLNEVRRNKLPMDGAPEDLGFKVFKLAPSNYEPWTGVPERDAETYIQEMGLYGDPLVKDWKPVNVIWEVAIKEGYGLNSHIEKIDAGQGNTVYRVSDPDKEQSFRICLDNEIKSGIDLALKLGADDLFICRDKALDDTGAANLALQCRLKTI